MSESNTTFRDLGLHDQVLEALDAMGFTNPTPVQENTIPRILEGKDVIGCAQTGTGKTAAYLLPILDDLSRKPDRPHKTNTLVIAPTRELAKQIDTEVEGLGYFVSVSSVPIYGGREGGTWDQQKSALKNGVDLVVGTPGRLWAHMGFEYFDLSGIENIILDEADRMLDMGFYDDIMRIINKIGTDDVRILLFSATMPKKIRQLGKEILNDPVEVNIAISQPAEGIVQGAYLVYNKNKVALATKLLLDKEQEVESAIIFSGTKRGVDQLDRALRKNGIDSKAIHSDLEQNDREEVLRLFRNRKFKILVATDVMSRGIDIKNIDLIINHDVPADPEDYVHRIGRTARAEGSGVAITFISEDPKDQRYFKKIEDLIEAKIPKMATPEDIGPSPQYSPGKGGGGYRKGKRNFKGKRKG